MKKYLIILTFISIISTEVFSQVEYSIGPKLGYSASNYDINGPTVLRFRVRSGMTGGFYLRYMKKRKFIFESGMQLTNKGSIQERFQDIPEIRYSALYLDIPLLVGLQPSKDFFQVKTGLQFSNLLNSVILAPEGVFDDNDYYREWDISALIELAYEFDFGLILSSRFSTGITRVNRINTQVLSTTNIDEVRFMNFQLSAAYNLPIYKRDF